MNREKAREFLEKELRKRPTVKASAIFTGKHGSMGFHAGRFYAVTIVKRRGEVVLMCAASVKAESSRVRKSPGSSTLTRKEVDRSDALT